MPRLNHRAYQILCSEIQKCAGNDPLNQIEQKLVVQDLEKLRSQSGSAASVEELRNLVIVTYPTFSEKALSAAAKANHSLGVWGQIRLAVLVFIGAAVVLVGTSGALGLAIILLSSTDSEPVASDASSSTNFTSMSSEEHFQEATVLVEQVEQSINKVTTPADLALCEKKLNEAKNHVDELPISYTVSSPVVSSRRSRRRIRRHYEQQTIYNDQFASLSSQVEQLQTQVTDLKAENTRASTLITTAKQVAFAAAKAGQNSPHSAARWQQIENLWSQAIDQLEEISTGNPSYVEAQKLLATYQTNLGIVQTRGQVEQESLEALEQANRQIEDLLASLPADAASLDRNHTTSQIESIINELESVQKGTTAYSRAEELLRSAKNKLKQLQP